MKVSLTALKRRSGKLFIAHGAVFVDTEGPSGVPYPTVEGCSTVDGEIVARAENLFGGGDTVDNDVVTAGTNASGETVIALEGGHGSVVADNFFCNGVKIKQRHPRLRGLPHGNQRLTDDGSSGF